MKQFSPEAINDITDQVMNILIRYNHSPRRPAIRKMIELWQRNKKPIDILCKSPDWNDDALAVVKKVKIQRPIDTEDQLDNFDSYLRMFGWPDKWDRLRYVMSMNKQFVDEEMLILLEDQKIKARIGQKMSRVAAAFFKECKVDQCNWFPKQFAKLADSINPMDIERPSILSVHPCDFISMSTGTGWDSCHSVLHHKCRQVGPFSYLMDGVTMIFYTVSEDYIGRWYDAKKITRQCFYFREGVLIQSRLYPSYEYKSDIETSDGYRVLVQSIIAECLGVPNLWHLSRNNEEIKKLAYTPSYAFQYPDYEHSKYNSTLSLLQEVENYELMTIGHRAYCIQCGYDLVQYRKLNCCDGVSEPESEPEPDPDWYEEDNDEDEDE